MSQDLIDWFESFSTQNVQIWCEDPETSVTSGVISKSFLTYRILMKQVGRDIVGVRHRYSEFEMLRTALKDRYAVLGISVPSLPPKNSMTSLITARSGDKSFIKERTLGLTMFCESIVASPWLKNDEQWKSFMKASSTSGVSAEVSSGNVGETRLIECLSQLEIPYKYTMVQRMEDVKEEVLLVEKHVRMLLDKVRSVQSCEKALSAANEHVGAQLAAWLDGERAVKSLAGRAFDENESMLRPAELVTSTLGATVSLLRTKHDSHYANPDFTGLTLATALEQELSLAESLKELLRVHEEILHGIDALSAKLSKAEAAKSAAAKPEVVAELRRCLEEKQTCLSAFYKGFIYFTLPTAARQRAWTLRKLTAAMAAAQLTSAFVLRKSCLDFFSSLGASPSSAIAETSRLLELLGIKPLQQLPEEEFQGGAAQTGGGGGDLGLQSGSLDALFQRALAIGKGKQVASVCAPLAAAATVAADASAPTPEKANPLAARRGSAVAAKSRSFLENASGGESAAAPPSPLSQRTRSLLDGLTSSAAGDAAPSGANVWDEV